MKDKKPEYYMVVWKEHDGTYGRCFNAVGLAEEYRERRYLFERRYCQNQRLHNRDFSYDNMGMYALVKTDKTFGLKVRNSLTDIPKNEFYFGERVLGTVRFPMLKKPTLKYFVAVHVDYEDEDTRQHTQYDVGGSVKNAKEAEKFRDYLRSADAPTSYEQSNVVDDSQSVRIVLANDNFGWTERSAESIKQCALDELPYECYEPEEDEATETMYKVVNGVNGFVYGVFTTENIAQYMKHRMTLDNPTDWFAVQECRGRRVVKFDKEKTAESAIEKSKAATAILKEQGVKLAEYFTTLDYETQRAFLNELREKGFIE